MPKFSNKIKDFFTKNEILTKKDFIIMGILTLVFTIMVLYRLGNTKAPITYYETDETNKDIVLDFGEYITIEKLHVFLGNLDNRKLSISTFNEVTGQWELINSEANVSSVFQWNDIDIYYTLRYLGIVATDEEAVFNEFVLTGPNNRIIKPVNAANYKNLFDEQYMYFTTDEHTYMDGTMFDEVYYARTGYEFIHHLPTYETTHPQLGKCIIALGMLIFGCNPFGWRIFVALIGVLFVPLLYSFGKVLFKDTFMATVLGIFITFDCMHYSLSRICTIDNIVAFFIILTYYYMYRYIEADKKYRTGTKWYSDKFPPKKVYTLLMLCGITMGCAIATKLTGVYAAVGLLIIMLYHTIQYWPRKQARNLIYFCLLFFIVTPLIIYTLAYIPAVEKWAHVGITDKSVSFDENGLNIAYGYTGLIARTLRNTNYMINYHKNLVATHPYQSPAESWPFIYKTLLAANNLVTTKSSDTMTVYIRSTMSYMGNPAIWWPCIPAIIYTFYCAILKRDKKAMFLSVAYIAQYIPWFGVNRCIFIYHYYPSAIFSFLMLGYGIDALIKRFPKTKKYICYYLIAVILLFIIFYPVISGIPFTDTWTRKLKWFDNWAFV